MIAVDTSVVVRLLAADDPKQNVTVRALFAAEMIWLAKTVLVENVRSEDEQSVAAALALTSHGIDFADALHLSSSPPGVAFVSFDRSFVRRANREGLADVSGVPVGE